MLIRIVVVVVVFAALAGLGWWLERRRRADAPTQPGSDAPAQLDRADFPRPDAPWLVVLFTSRACDSCAGLYDKARPLESPEVAVVEVEYPGAKALHERYQIEAAPTTVIADAQGVVRAEIVGAFDATELWNTVAEVRR